MKKRNAVKIADCSRVSAATVKAKKDLEPSSFLFWLDMYTRPMAAETNTSQVISDGDSYIEGIEGDDNLII